MGINIESVKVNNNAKSFSGISDKKAESITPKSLPINASAVLIGTAAAAGVAALAISSILIHRKSPEHILSMSKKVLSEAEEIKNVGEKVLAKTRATIDEVTGFIKDGASKNFEDVTDETGKIIRKFELATIDDKKAAKKMLEFTPSGKLFRETNISFGTEVESIEEFIGKTRNTIDLQTSYIDLFLDTKTLPNGVTKAAKVFEFNRDFVTGYGTHIEFDKQKELVKTHKLFEFDKGLLKRFEYTGKKNTSQMQFDKGNLVEFTKHPNNDEGRVLAGLHFEDNKVIENYSAPEEF